MTEDTPAPARLGRTPATSHREISEAALALFAERGFDETTVDDIARASGISRRTLFRYFPSKHDLPWGEFEAQIDALEQRLTATAADVPLGDAVRDAVIAVNSFPAGERDYHRQRMRLLLTVPALAAHASPRYAAWRSAVATFVAARRDEPIDALVPQAIAWGCLGFSIAAYERWLSDADSDLTTLLDSAFRSTRGLF